MNAKIIASLAFTSMFSLSTLLSPAHAEEQEKAAAEYIEKAVDREIGYVSVGAERDQIIVR